jgi:hypothetical protein
MASRIRKQVRWAAPLVASSSVVITLVSCVIIAKARHVYTGGLKWPYFSDMGRDSPGYYVFCVGLTTCALALACTWYFNYQFQRVILQKAVGLGQLSTTVIRFVRLAAAFGIISVIGLPGLVREC